MAKNTNPQHSEGPIAKAIEKQTAKLPSDIFLWLGLGCMGAAMVLRAMRRSNTGIIVGEWASPLLIMGLYNKLVKLEGHSGSEYDETESSFADSAREVRRAVGA